MQSKSTKMWQKVKITDLRIGDQIIISKNALYENRTPPRFVMIPKIFKWYVIRQNYIQVYFKDEKESAYLKHNCYIERSNYNEEDRRKKAYQESCNEIWETFYITLGKNNYNKLKNTYRVKLFGKRGQYEESGERRYFRQDLKAMQKLREIIGNKFVQNIEIEYQDEIETGYSRNYETECYGMRNICIKINFADKTNAICYF